LILAGGKAFGPGELLFWDLAARKALHTHKDHKAAIHSVAISPESGRVVTGGVLVCDSDGKLVKRLEGSDNYTKWVAFSPNGKHLASAGGAVHLRDAENFALVKGAGDLPGISACFTPDGKALTSVTISGQVHALDLASNRVSTVSSKVDGQSYYHVEHSPGGQLMLLLASTRGVATKDFVAEVWTSSPALPKERKFAVTGHFLGTAFSHGGRYLFLGEMRLDEPNRILAVDTNTGKVVHSWVAADKAHCIRHIVASSDNKYLVSCDDGYATKVWDLEGIDGMIRKASK
jgi:WD40 repeat protein